MRSIRAPRPALLAAFLAAAAFGQIHRLPNQLPTQPNQSAPVNPQPAAKPPAAQQAAPATTTAAPSGPPAVYGGLSLNNASLPEVIDMLARQLKISYILDPRVKGGVSVNTYGETKNIDPKSLLEAILRINGAGMVKEGELYRIVPMSDISHHPLPPEKPSDLDDKEKDDDQIMLNLIFLKYVTSGELMKVLSPFVGENASIFDYPPANLLLLLDNRRSMRRLMDLVAMFDSDALTNQRVHVFEVKHGRATEISKELETIVKSISLSDKQSPIKFLPIDRINTIIAVAPNPGAFAAVEKWMDKLDIPVKSRAGAVTNYVYRLRYGDSQVIACSITALYAANYSPLNGGGGSMARCLMMSGAGLYGGGFGGGLGGGFGGGLGGGFGGGGGLYGGGMYGGGTYGGGMYGGNGYAGNGYAGAMSGNGLYGGSPYESGYQSYNNMGATATGIPLAGAGAAPQSPTAGNDITGNYLGTATTGSQFPRIPRVVANPFNNTLLIQATPDEYENILGMLKELDVPPRQVLIEAKIYSIDLTHTLNSGVTSASLQQKAGSTYHNVLGSLAGDTTTLTGAALVGKSRELLATVKLQESENKAKLIQAPSVIATDSIPASINIGGSVPAETGSAVSGVSGTVATAVSNVNTGVGLNIVARVTPSGVVTLVIGQTINNVAPQGTNTGSNIDSPSFNTNSVSTQVTVQDGDTIAIGGIINETTTVVEQGIPLLHRIPYIGSLLFGSRNYTKDRQEFIMFLTPHVIYDANQLNDASEELKQRIRLMRKDVRE